MRVEELVAVQGEVTLRKKVRTCLTSRKLSISLGQKNFRVNLARNLLETFGQPLRMRAGNFERRACIQITRLNLTEMKR